MDGTGFELFWAEVVQGGVKAVSVVKHLDVLEHRRAGVGVGGKTTNADRAAIGITVRDTSPTPAPASSSRPLALVESGQRLTHQLRLVDESTPTRPRRPTPPRSCS